MPGSTTRSVNTVRRAAVVTHGRSSVIAGALERLEAVADAAEVELVDHGEVDLAVALGGDGTMLRALHRYLATPVPVMVQLIPVGTKAFPTPVGSRRTVNV